MGSSTLLDIIGSILIGGFMLLILHSVNQTASENSAKYSGDLITQQNLVSVIELLEHDFARIGYCSDVSLIPAKEDMITYADSNKIVFLTDLQANKDSIQGDGTLESLVYELGPKVTETPNENDRLLYRYIDGGAKSSSNLGITKFTIKYYDNLDNELPHTSGKVDSKLIAYMQIDIKVEDVYGYDISNTDKTYEERFPTTFWRQIKLASKNLNR